MKTDFQLESDRYSREVQDEAQRLLQRGEGSPWECLMRAHGIVQKRRRERSQSREEGR